jgi:hypothetical protein
MTLVICFDQEDIVFSELVKDHPVKQDENLRLIATGYRIETCRRA